VAIIPARGNSVRIPRKNVREFRGKPMMQWPIEAARASGLFDKIIVSTDDDEIAQWGIVFGCDVIRRSPDDGTKGTQEVARDVLQSGLCRSAVMACVTYPCSPLLHPADLYGALLVLENQAAHYVISVRPEVIQDAGCFYFGRADAFRSGWPLVTNRSALYPLPAERCIDINTPEDWARAESMFDALRSNA
jgi:N-acylneuraminate cytidylyltransferase